MEGVIAEAVERGAGLDGKTALQELVAAAGLGVPEYQITESGPDHDKDFVAVVIVNGKTFPAASASRNVSGDCVFVASINRTS